jgi:hypothetical protein
MARQATTGVELRAPRRASAQVRLDDGGVLGALERVLETFVDRDFLSTADAESIGRGVLADNVRRLHGI